MRTTHRRHDPFRRGRAGLSRADVLTMIFCGTILPLLTMAWIGCGKTTDPAADKDAGSGIGTAADTLFTPKAVEQRQQCKHNLKQLALAMHNNHDTDKFFPPGSTSRASWPAYILPYIDQKAIYDDPACNPRAGGTAPLVTDGTVNSTTINVFLCPANAEATKVDGGISYVGISGRQAPREKRVSSLTGVFRDESYDRDGNPKTEDKNTSDANYMGWSTRGNYFRFRDCTDGTSSTVMLGENHPWRRPLGSPFDPAANLTMAWETGDGVHLNAGGAFGSGHPGGAHFALVDGSAAFVADDADPTAVLSCLTIRGSETADLPREVEPPKKKAVEFPKK